MVSWLGRGHRTGAAEVAWLEALTGDFVSGYMTALWRMCCVRDLGRWLLRKRERRRWSRSRSRGCGGGGVWGFLVEERLFVNLARLWVKKANWATGQSAVEIVR